MENIPARNQVTTDFRGHHTIPPEFPTVLKDFVREVLREQPDNIYRFGRDYFENLAFPDDEGLLPETSGRRIFEGMSDEELLSWLTELFVAADTDNNGTLDRSEFKEIMKHLNLSPQEAIHVFVEADVDESGSLEYEEFLPLMVQVLQTISSMDALQENERGMTELAEATADYMIRGMSGTEMEAMVVKMFAEADLDDSGSIDITEMKHLLKKCNINLTKKEANILFMSVDADGNGCIDIMEFIPVFHEVMRTMLADEAMQALQRERVKELPNIIVNECRKFDPEETGFLKAPLICRALQEADLGVSAFQIYSIISEASPAVMERVLHGDNQDLIDYQVFTNEHIAPGIARLVDVDFEVANYTAKVTKAQLDEATAAAYRELNMTAEEFTDILSSVFVACDTNKDGYLDMDEFEEAISTSGLVFSDREKLMLKLAADENGDGMVSYGEFAAIALQMLVWTKNQQIINPVMQELGESPEP